MKPFVLIAEDEKAVAELLRYNLEREGYDTAVAPDGDEAMLLLEERLPDLVLLDWMLPKVPGIEVCRQLRRKAETRSLPIIMLTAHSERARIVIARDAGVNEFIIKPLSPEILFKRLDEVIEHARSFIRTKNYFGPDRRRRDKDHQGEDRRGKAPAAKG